MTPKEVYDYTEVSRLVDGNEMRNEARLRLWTCFGFSGILIALGIVAILAAYAWNLLQGKEIKIVEKEIPVITEKVVTVEVPIITEKIVEKEIPVITEKVVTVEVPIITEKIVEVPLQASFPQPPKEISENNPIVYNYTIFASVEYKSFSYSKPVTIIAGFNYKTSEQKTYDDAFCYVDIEKNGEIVRINLSYKSSHTASAQDMIVSKALPNYELTAMRNKCPYS